MFSLTLCVLRWIENQRPIAGRLRYWISSGPKANEIRRPYVWRLRHLVKTLQWLPDAGAGWPDLCLDHGPCRPKVNVLRMKSSSKQKRVNPIHSTPSLTIVPQKLEQRSLAGLRRAARDCRACDLWKNATQTVFGEGPLRAKIVFVGEQPGDQEDLAGHPFVGPAGKVLDEALHQAGIDRSEVYVTNVVKHFK